MQPQSISGQIKTQVILSLGINLTVVDAFSCSKMDDTPVPGLSSNRPGLSGVSRSRARRCWQWV
jgi:hypothetical protein